MQICVLAFVNFRRGIFAPPVQELSRKSLLHLCTTLHKRKWERKHTCDKSCTCFCNEDAAGCGQTHRWHAMLWREQRHEKPQKCGGPHMLHAQPAPSSFFRGAACGDDSLLMRFHWRLRQRLAGAYIPEYVLQGWLVSTSGISLSLKGRAQNWWERKRRPYLSVRWATAMLIGSSAMGGVDGNSKQKPQVLLEQEQKIRAKARRFDGLLYFVRVFYRELSFF